jgi:hypothetical protein
VATKSSAGVRANPPFFARVIGVLHALTTTTSSGDFTNVYNFVIKKKSKRTRQSVCVFHAITRASRHFEQRRIPVQSNPTEEDVTESIKSNQISRTHARTPLDEETPNPLVGLT